MRSRCDISKNHRYHALTTSSVLELEDTEVISLTMTIPSDPKIDSFEVIQTPYKKIEDHEIRCDILIPRAKHEGKRLVIVNFHGGGLVCTPLRVLIRRKQLIHE